MLILPAEYKKSSVLVSKTSLNWKDPRKEDGDILWPERYNKKSIDELRADLGSAAADAQLAQDPKPSSGGLFNKDWWRVLDMSPSDISQIVQFWDCAQKPGITNDYSVCATWAITSNGYYIMDVWRDKVTTPVLEVMAKELYEKYKPSAVVIEDKSAGSPLIQYLLAFTTMPVLAYNPGKLDKETRATAATPTVEAGKVAIPKMAKWRDTFVSEHERFPKSTHDDQVDTTSMAIAWLKMRSGDGPRIRTL
jgi:predicted phage terminase large subunit-like protein